MKIVTAGTPYIDIDAYAGCIAYAELLNLIGDEALPVSTVKQNESINATIRNWHAPLKTHYDFNENDTFVLIDVSDPNHFETFVDTGRVAEIIDHHPEAKKYWEKRLGKSAQIDLIGAACTLVYERWKQAGMLGQLNSVSAKLLTAGILDNTLNFQAVITTQRDKQAYADLLTRTDLTDKWPAQYFSECQQAIMQDVEVALQNDTKIMEFPSIGHKIAVGQLVVWDATEALKRAKDIKATMQAFGEEWFINLVSINDKKSHFIVSGDDIKSFLANLLSVKFEGMAAVADRLWLRKEIMSKDLERKATSKISPERMKSGK